MRRTGEMKKTKVLVLGNSPQINQIDFNLLQKDVITLGVNRIWLKHIPNYFFFHDIQIYRELSQHPESLAKLIQNSTIFSSDWLKKNKHPDIPKWTSIYTRVKCNPRDFPDSVTSAIQIFAKNIMPSSHLTFYIAATPLAWEQPSHFWKELEYSSLNENEKEWYDRRFPLMEQNFRSLRNAKYDIISVTPTSVLNKIFRYETIGNLYVRDTITRPSQSSTELLP